MLNEDGEEIMESAFYLLAKLEKLVLIDISKISNTLVNINSCKRLKKLTIDTNYIEDYVKRFLPIDEISLEHLISFKLRVWSPIFSDF